MRFIPLAMPRLEWRLALQEARIEEEVAKAAAKNVERRVIRLLMRNVNVNTHRDYVPPEGSRRESGHCSIYGHNEVSTTSAPKVPSAQSEPSSKLRERTYVFKDVT